MAGGGRPPTTFPCCTRQSRGWPAFAGHDTRGACHLGRTSMLPPVRIRQQHPPRRGLPGFGCAMSAVKRRAGPRPIRVLSVYPFCICVESFLLCRVPHRCPRGTTRCGVRAWRCASWSMRICHGGAFPVLAAAAFRRSSAGRRGRGAPVRPGVPHGARAFAEVNAALMDDRGASNLR
jgi:hypothetical protein